jgi:hypothetical protein
LKDYRGKKRVQEASLVFAEKKEEIIGGGDDAGQS